MAAFPAPRENFVGVIQANSFTNYNSIREVIAEKLDNTTVTSKTCRKVDLFIAGFYGIGNVAASNKAHDQGAFRGLIRGELELKAALADVDKMSPGQAKDVLSAKLERALNEVVQFKNSLQLNLPKQGERCNTMDEAFAVNMLLGQRFARPTSR